MTKPRDTETRRRVERVLSGDARSDDVPRIFLALRERSYGRAIFREISDFFAHSDSRKKGLVTDHARAFFAHLRFSIANKDATSPIHDIKGDLPGMLRSQLMRLGSAYIKQHTGINWKGAERTLARALKRYIRRTDGSYHQITALTSDEKRLIDCCVDAPIGTSVFKRDAVINELLYVLEKNNVLFQSERTAFLKASPWVELSIVTAMHQTEIQMEDGWAAVLSANYYPELFIKIDASAHFPENPHVNVVFPIFHTRLNARDFCDPILLERSEAGHRPLEVGPGPKLIPL